MDIIDIMLARAMTPQGKTETYVAKANAAAAKAEKAEQDAQAAIDTIEAASTEIETARSDAADLLAEAQEALQTAQEAQINMPVAYGQTGQNIDGYMTQKAVTDALAQKADSTTIIQIISSKADKSYVDQQIASIAGGGGGGSIHLNTDDSGHLVVIDENGNIIASAATEEELIEALIRSGTFVAKDGVGLDIDYANRTFTRVQDAAAKGVNFNSYAMYGGRRRCNVSDSGEILAFEGDVGYTEDGSNGMVMVYQPKFYYMRQVIETTNTEHGRIMRHEQLLLSPTKQSGFKLAPIFGDELEYVLLPAFEGAIVDGKLASISGVTPVTNITITEAETAATARGTGWHITNLAAESANQMLEIVEWGTMNGQEACGNGNSAGTELIDTGTSGALTYRGMENPWGNRWRMIGGVEIVGDGAHNGGAVYVCKDFNYTPGRTGSNYDYVDFDIPNTMDWVNAMSYCGNEYDWIYLPAECNSTANSLLPVGDNIYITSNSNITSIAAVGGYYSRGNNNGPFYYAFDRTVQESSRYNYGASLMFIPTKNAIYEANLIKAGA